MLSLADLRRSSCIRPAAEKTRSTPADEAGIDKYCLTILASLGHIDSLSFQYASRSRSMSVSSGADRYSSSSSRSGAAEAAAGVAAGFLSKEARETFFEPAATGPEGAAAGAAAEAGAAAGAGSGAAAGEGEGAVDGPAAETLEKLGHYLPVNCQLIAKRVSAR